MKRLINISVILLIFGLVGSVSANPTHNEGPFAAAGEFIIDNEILQKWYHVKNVHNGDNPDTSEFEMTPALHMHTFGTYQMLNDIPTITGGDPPMIFNPQMGESFKSANGQPLYVRDLHYPLLKAKGRNGEPKKLRGADGKQLYGVRILPINDREGSFNESWEMDPRYAETVSPLRLTYDSKAEVAGSQLVDQILRDTFNLEATDPVFGIIAYIHPEKFVSKLTEIGGFLKTEMGVTHMGAYIGEGQTRNAPFTYHDQKWTLRSKWDDGSKAGGYPTMIHTLSLADVPQAVMNQNLIITLRLLNEYNQELYEGGVVFPVGDYKFDNVHGVTLRENFAHYRAWLDPEWANKEFNKKILPFTIAKLEAKVERHESRGESEVERDEAYKAELSEIVSLMDEVIANPKGKFDNLKTAREKDLVYALDTDLSALAAIKRTREGSQRNIELGNDVKLLAENAKAEALEMKEAAESYYPNLKSQLAELNTPAGKQKFIDETPYIKFVKESEQLATYCAEHIYMAMNIAVNLPQNLKGYTDIWGPEVGADLFAKANEAWKKINTAQRDDLRLVKPDTTIQASIPAIPEFTPIWQRNDPKVRQNDLPYFGNPVAGGAPQTVGKAMVFAPVSTADILFNFVETYVPWQIVGSDKSAITIYNFASDVNSRVGMAIPEFIGIANGLAARMVVFDAIANAGGPDKVDAFIAQKVATIATVVKAGLTKSLISKGKSEEEAAGIAGMIGELIENGNESIKGIKWYFANTMPGPERHRTQEYIASWISKDLSNPSEYQKFYSQYRRMAIKDLKTYRAVKVAHPLIEQIQIGDPESEEYVNGPKNIQYYAPPKTIHAITLGLYESNPYVTFNTVGTVVDVSEVSVNKDAQYTLYNPVDGSMTVCKNTSCN